MHSLFIRKTVSMAAVISGLTKLEMRAAHFVVSEVDSMADEPVDISLYGLASNCKITLRSQVLLRNKFKFSAYGHHLSDDRGSLLTSSDPSVGGTYLGVDPMGLIRSLQPEKTERKGLRYLPNIFAPMEVNVSAFVGHIEDFDGKEKVTETTIRRHWIADNVDYHHIRHGKLRGILFTPKDKSRQYPGVIDVYGSGGGIMPHRAALLASKGFVTFSLAFFRYQDLPESMNRIDLDYFVDAVDYVRQLDCVKPGGIGGIGLSKGSDLMIEVAALTPHLKVVACINGLSYPMFCTLFWKGKAYRKPLAVDWSRVHENEDNSIVVRDCHFEDFPESSMLPVEQVNAKIGFFVSLADENVPALLSASKLITKMKNHGREANYDLFTFEGAGHIIDPSYMPHCSAQYMPYMGGYIAAYGGTPEEHHQAQLRFWPLLIDFLKAHLDDNRNSCKARL